MPQVDKFGKLMQVDIRMCKWKYLDRNGICQASISYEQMRSWHVNGQLHEGMGMNQMNAVGYTTIPELFPPPMEPFKQWPRTMIQIREAERQRKSRGIYTAEEQQERVRQMEAVWGPRAVISRARGFSRPGTKSSGIVV